MKLIHYSILFFILSISACTLSPTKSEQAFSFIETSIADIQQAITAGQISCQDITEQYIQRIETYDKPSQLNAITQINPKAVQKAIMLDKQFTETGTLKKLHCVPVILKDNFDTADMPTEAGAIALKGSIPPDDAFMVQQLRAEGAIIIAKSNMGEWAFSPYNTISSTHGETRNAYDLERVPAGSSGGTASAIAANFGVIGMGTDTGNSIRGPASHLSLVGIRSTLGATSRDGVVPLLLNRDIAGPLMRSVTDTAKVYSIIAGYDPADPITIAVKNNTAVDYTHYLKEGGLKGARLGVLRQIFDTETADKEMLALMQQAINDLEKAGAKIIDPFYIEGFDELKKATGFCSRFPHDLNSYLDTLGDTRVLTSFDEMIEKKRYRPENQGPMNWAMNGRDDPELRNPPCTSVQDDPRRLNFLNAVVSAMDTAKIDAIIYPSWSNPPRLIGDTESPHGNNSPVIPPHTGQPAITVPMGFTQNGLPAGLQFLARPFDEHTLFQYAYAYEQQTLHRKPPRFFGAIVK